MYINNSYVVLLRLTVCVSALLSIVAVSCSGVALCLVVICIGVACLRRSVVSTRITVFETIAYTVNTHRPMINTRLELGCCLFTTPGG